MTQHNESMLAEHDPNLGYIYGQEIADNNRGIVIIAQEGKKHFAKPNAPMSLSFNEKSMLRFFSTVDVSYSMSPDGRRIVYAVRFYKDGQPSGYTIWLENELLYRSAFNSPTSVLGFLRWVDEDIFEWQEWKTGPVSEVGRTCDVHHFRNGVDITAEREDIIRAREGCIDVDVEALLNEKPIQQPEVKMIGSEDDPRFQVCYQSYTGPIFFGIGNDSVGCGLAQNHSETKVGYCGITTGFLGNTLYKVAEKIFLGEHGIFKNEPHELGFVRRALYYGVAIPATLLYNPYFGPLYYAGKMSDRYTPVDHDHVWDKQYRWAGNPFYTPDDRLVVSVRTRRGACVAIDEKEGPVYDQIFNVRFLADENCVSYVGQRKNTFYRVTVK